MKAILLVLFLSFTGMLSAQVLKDGEMNIPVFAAVDSLGVFGEWQTVQYKGDKGEDITLSCRFLVRKKFMMTCLYKVEVRNDGNKDVKLTFMAGNNGTSYYSGQIGVVREKIKVAAGAVTVVEYRLPTKTNAKEDIDEVVCKKCKELDHIFKFAK